MATDEEIIRAERRAWVMLKELADDLADECLIIWKYGDGYGGNVLDAIREAFHKRGADQVVYGSGARSRGRIPNKVRKLVFERDAYRCVKCTDHVDLQIDHVFPHSKGGSDDPENLQTLCGVCNRLKKDKVEAME